ncbi:sulfotransferase [Rhizobium sp. L1K21]|uniref:sulfotransferase family protein n=1 Tax=Rhizobium sp. L1K21 TaxID=2954933 RepID=UPI0020921B6E|nr:sulfotransferase [Rhizobium sp. L1K21]MCO6184853.1 sulfotransferase [Rhizobium sp. L1K21]
MVAQVDKIYTRQHFRRLWARLLSYALFEGRPLTTRGRFINPLVFFNYRLAELLIRKPRVEKPIFIVGAGRSGTTILGVVMSVHPDVGFLNEPKALWHHLIKYEDVIGSYTDGEAKYRLDESDVKDEMSLRARKILTEYTLLTGSKRVVDKYPEIVFRRPFVKTIYPDAKFIFISRNGWDACTSISDWSVRKGVVSGEEVHDWWGKNDRKWFLLVDQLVPEHPDLKPHIDAIRMLEDHRLRAAVEWIITMREGLKALSEEGANCFHVRHEDLSSEPQKSCREILNFCELRDDAGCLGYAENVLKPVPSRGEFELPDYLIDPFREVQEALDAL